MEECSEFLLHVTVVAKTLTTVNASKTVDFWTNEILKGCKIASYHDKSDPVYTAAKILCAAEEADEFKELIISILKNIIIIDDSPSLKFLSDSSWFDPFGSIAEYRYEFWPLIGIFDDEVFIIFDSNSPHRNSDKNLLMKLNSA